MIVIVGKGILGLSCAEALSRSNNRPIRVIFDPAKSPGSSAAAANLATKGQQFARDPHFALKLEAKALYKNWIENLLTELPKNSKLGALTVENLYLEGNGLDFFETTEERSRQLLRVQQPAAELEARSLPLDAIEPIQENQIRYKGEAWVDAEKLLLVLEEVCRGRGVHFEAASLTKGFNPNSPKGKSLLILCMGAWTKNTLVEMGLPTTFLKRERLTIGSTFLYRANYKDLFPQWALFDGHHQCGLKFTFSGNSESLFLSSSTCKAESLDPREVELILEKHDKSLLEAGSHFLQKQWGFAPAPSEWQVRTGWRVGFGHSEIVVKKLENEWNGSDVVVCAGAHKSGFLFAPVVGRLIEEFVDTVEAQ